MSETKFTPGPWIWFPNRDGEPDTEYSVDWLGSPDASTDCITDSIRNRANARLIAAAPEMYEELLTTSVLILALMDEYQPGADTWKKLQRRLFKIYEILGKVRGGE